MSASRYSRVYFYLAGCFLLFSPSLASSCRLRTSAGNGALGRRRSAVRAKRCSAVRSILVVATSCMYRNHSIHLAPMATLHQPPPVRWSPPNRLALRRDPNRIVPHTPTASSSAVYSRPATYLALIQEAHSGSALQPSAMQGGGPLLHSVPLLRLAMSFDSQRLV